MNGRKPDAKAAAGDGDTSTGDGIALANSAATSPEGERATQAQQPKGRTRAPSRPARRDPSAAKRRRSARLWIPQYHGGWAMVVVPPIMGMIEGGFRLAHLPLFLLWFVGYFLFYCATVWLRSHAKARYLPPVRAYGIAVLALGVVTLACAPYLWRWAFVFAPLVAFAGWAAWKRDERSLASGFDTVVAACLMLPVMWDVSTGGEAGLRATSHIWVLTAMFFGYFAGTIFYVKTNVRKRGSNAYLAASALWHAAWTVAAAVLAVRGDLAWWHAAVWVALTARAIAVPMRGRAGKPVSVAAIGAGEVVTCLVFTASLF